MTSVICSGRIIADDSAEAVWFAQAVRSAVPVAARRPGARQAPVPVTLWAVDSAHSPRRAAQPEAIAGGARTDRGRGRRALPCRDRAPAPSVWAPDSRAYGATRKPRAPLDARTTTMPSSATKAIEYGAALRSSGDSEPGSLMAVAAMARF